MVAPIDAKASFEVEGETFTLHLNFRTLKLAKSEGVNLMSGQDMDPIDIATAVRCLATPSHPKLTDEEAFALVMNAPEAAATAIGDLFERFGGSAEGNAPKKRAKKQA